MTRLMLALVIVFAGANDTALARKVMGTGMSSCAEWVRARSAEGPERRFLSISGVAHRISFRRQRHNQRPGNS